MHKEGLRGYRMWLVGNDPVSQKQRPGLLPLQLIA